MLNLPLDTQKPHYRSPRHMMCWKTGPDFGPWLLPDISRSHCLDPTNRDILRVHCIQVCIWYEGSKVAVFVSAPCLAKRKSGRRYPSRSTTSIVSRWDTILITTHLWACHDNGKVSWSPGTGPVPSSTPCISQTRGTSRPSRWVECNLDSCVPAAFLIWLTLWKCIDSLVQDCGNSSDYALELQQSWCLLTSIE